MHNASPFPLYHYRDCRSVSLAPNLSEAQCQKRIEFSYSLWIPMLSSSTVQSILRIDKCISLSVHVYPESLESCKSVLQMSLTTLTQRSYNGHFFIFRIDYDWYRKIQEVKQNNYCDLFINLSSCTIYAMYIQINPT